jgi:hypothetical protein
MSLRMKPLRHWRGSHAGLVACALLVAACGDSGSDPDNGDDTGGSAGTWNGVGGSGGTSNNPGGTGGSGGSTLPQAGSFCDALAAVRSKCQSCHGAERAFGAPMSLVKYEDFTAKGVIDTSKKVYELIAKRIHDVQRPMPPVGSPELSSQESAALDAWIAKGAPAGSDPTCGGGQNPPPPPPPPPDPGTVNWPADCEQFYTITASGPSATVGAGQETHPQFMIKQPWPGEAQALAFAPITDNKKILHHWILYHGQRFVTGWAPGSETGRKPLPADVGIFLPPGTDPTQLRLDMHYNNKAGTAAERDASGVKICAIITKSKFRPNMAAMTYLHFAAFPVIQPHQQIDIVGTCNVNASAGTVHLLTSSPHMHQLGVHAKFERIRSGQTTTMHDKPFSFDDQRSWSLDPEVLLQTGDQVRTTCRYNNTTGGTVRFGQNTTDEMCFNFALYWPKDGFSCR